MNDRKTEKKRENEWEKYWKEKRMNERKTDTDRKNNRQKL